VLFNAFRRFAAICFCVAIFSTSALLRLPPLRPVDRLAKRILALPLPFIGISPKRLHCRPRPQLDIGDVYECFTGGEAQRRRKSTTCSLRGGDRLAALLAHAARIEESPIFEASPM
jgi:hypothetical protein